NIPWAVLLDPTSACNLHCTGCWAADYGNKLNLSYMDIDSIVTQGKQLGIYMYIYTGGEPLIRKKDIIRLCEKHNDCVFLCFTNGTLIDEDFCADLLRVKNFVPAISLEGNREVTDSRRGEGTYDAVMRAMMIMKAFRLPFGISCCYTSENIDSVISDEFIDDIVDRGAYFIWYFHYMPVGSDANIQLMVNPEQREKAYHRIREIRMTKPLFAIDFQNDGQYVQGCIAGGRRYLHINAAGDVDPCVFIHFSDSNIHDMPLIEALGRPLFKAYHDGQPFNGNMLRPCPMLENPEILPKLVKETGAKSSNLEGEETAEMLSNRCKEYAENWKPHAEDLWAKDHKMGKFYH
ncbi:MAG: radical SAM protein, partial [Coriobacteriales bacterium]